MLFCRVHVARGARIPHCSCSRRRTKFALAAKKRWGSKPGQVLIVLVVHCLVEVKHVWVVWLSFFEQLYWPVPVWRHMHLLNLFNSQQPHAYKDKQFVKCGPVCATSSQTTPLIHCWVRGRNVGFESSVTKVLQHLTNMQSLPLS